MVTHASYGFWQRDCNHGTDASTLGALVINSLDSVSQASFRLSVGTLEPASASMPLDDALYLDFMRNGEAVDVPGEENSTRPAALLKMQYMKEQSKRRELEGRPGPFRSALGDANTEDVYIHEKEGIDLMAPSDTTHNGDAGPHVVRVSMYSEFTGG